MESTVFIANLNLFLRNEFHDMFDGIEVVLQNFAIINHDAEVLLGEKDEIERTHRVDGVVIGQKCLVLKTAKSVK
jgi:hypothetical protein